MQRGQVPRLFSSREQAIVPPMSSYRKLHGHVPTCNPRGSPPITHDVPGGNSQPATRTALRLTKTYTRTQNNYSSNIVTIAYRPTFGSLNSESSRTCMILRNDLVLSLNNVPIYSPHPHPHSFYSSIRLLSQYLSLCSSDKHH